MCYGFCRNSVFRSTRFHHHSSLFRHYCGNSSFAVLIAYQISVVCLWLSLADVGYSILETSHSLRSRASRSLDVVPVKSNHLLTQGSLQVKSTAHFIRVLTRIARLTLPRQLAGDAIFVCYGDLSLKSTFARSKLIICAKFVCLGLSLLSSVLLYVYHIYLMYSASWAISYVYSTLRTDCMNW